MASITSWGEYLEAFRPGFPLVTTPCSLYKFPARRVFQPSRRTLSHVYRATLITDARILIVPFRSRWYFGRSLKPSYLTHDGSRGGRKWRNMNFIIRTFWRWLRSSSLLLGLFVCTLGITIFHFASRSTSLKSLNEHGIHMRNILSDSQTGTFRLQSPLAGCSLYLRMKLWLRKSSFWFLYFYLILNSHNPWRFSISQYLRVGIAWVAILVREAFPVLNQTAQTNLDNQVRSLCHRGFHNL